MTVEIQQYGQTVQLECPATLHPGDLADAIEKLVGHPLHWHGLSDGHTTEADLDEHSKVIVVN